MRVLIDDDPYRALTAGKPWPQRGVWPCKWVSCPGVPAPPFVTAYRLRFELDAPAAVRAHVSADERYELFVDGRRIGRGPERGDPRNWYFETYDLTLEAGAHVIVARVWSLGDKAPYAQMSVYSGFIFATEGDWIERLATGTAPWECKPLEGYRFVEPYPAWGTGWNLDLDGSLFPWGVEAGEGESWAPAVPRHEGAGAASRNEYPRIHLMRPATLPPMIDRPWPAARVRYVDDPGTTDTRTVSVQPESDLGVEHADWELVGTRRTVTVPPHTQRRVIFDLGDYVCAYPVVTVSGGAGSIVRLLWAESLFEQPDTHAKGDRDEVEGKYFHGVGDTFRPDGAPQRRFETLWWQTGRYIELFVETADAPLVIEHLELRETRYPLEMEGAVDTEDERFSAIVPILLRGLWMCAHETYMDCPYYEQLMYVGDTRLEALVTYVTSRDDRLPRKALRLFDASRLDGGLTQSRYPSRVTQIIPPFSLWWIGMVYDYARWRGDPAFIRGLLPGVRAVLDCFLEWRNADGLVGPPNGWNYMDWVPVWRRGIPPGADSAPSGPINWQTVLALGYAAELEEWLGERELAARARRLARELAAAATAAFWNAERGLLADEPEHKHFSEHVQCLALLSGALDAPYRDAVSARLFRDADLAATTIYFSHYLFETARLLGQMDVFFDRLALWTRLLDLGLKTTIESPEPSRSDCHGWGAHPLYHYFASVLGIRPAGFGFDAVAVEPQLGPLRRAGGTLVHPRGAIRIAFERTDERLAGAIDLPEGVSGQLRYMGRSKELRPGSNSIALEPAPGR